MYCHMCNSVYPGTHSAVQYGGFEGAAFTELGYHDPFELGLV